MKRPKYDKRMHLIDNWRFGIWRPFICKIRGHKFTCYKIIPTEPQEWVHMCHRCVIMLDELEPCGTCNNGCRRDDEEGREGEFSTS